MNYTFALNQVGTSFGNTPHLTLRPGPSGSITITKPLAAASGGLLLWDAYSWWDNDVGNGDSPVPNQVWNNAFEIWASNEGSAFVKIWAAYEEGINPNLYATSALAYAALNAMLPLTFDGYDTYQIRAIFDSVPADNRGGTSLLINVNTGVLYRDIVLQAPDAPVKEEWNWLTDTQVSYNGSEDQTPLLTNPKRIFSGNFSFDDVKDLRKYQATMQKGFRGIFRAPLFQYQVKLKQAIAVASSELMCNPLRGDFRVDGEALITEGSTWEVVVIGGIQSDRLTLQNTTRFAYSPRALITPLTQVFTPSGAQLHRVNPNHSGTADFTFRELRPWVPFLNPLESEALTTFDTMFVLDNRAIGSQFDMQFESGLVISDEYIGLPDLVNPWTQGQWVFALQWQCNRVFDIHDWFWWQKFCNALGGAQTNFLIPTFRDDLEVFTKASGSGNVITFTGHEFRDHYYGLDTFARLVIESSAGRQFVKVTGISNVSGNDRVTFSPALPAGDWSIDQTVGFLMKVRSADDKVTCNHYGLHTDISMSIRTVK